MALILTVIHWSSILYQRSILARAHTIAASSLAHVWGAAVFNLNIKFLTSEILKMTSSGIPSWPPGKLYTEFQLEEMEKELDEKKLDGGNVINGDGCSYQRRCCYSRWIIMLKKKLNFYYWFQDKHKIPDFYLTIKVIKSNYKCNKINSICGFDPGLYNIWFY